MTERIRERSTAGTPRVLPRTVQPLWLRRSRVHAGLIAGVVVLITIILTAVLAPLIAPYDPYSQNLANRLVVPVWTEGGSWAHPLGTDQFGRDYLSRLIYGARISLFIGFTAMAISAVIGTTLGLLAGYFGGRVDMFVTYVITTRLAMPVILVALAVVSLAGSSLFVVVTVLGLLIWDQFAVVVRSATQQARSQDYVASASAVGCSYPRIILSEIMPNIFNHLIVVATLEMAHAILLESALSFLGLGVQPPLPSWGLMISEAKGLIFFEPWLIAIPGAALLTLVLAINLLGDGLRDVTASESRL